MRELIIRKDPSLLDNFLEEVISFLGDSSSHVKQFVIAFLEEAWYVILIGNRYKYNNLRNWKGQFKHQIFTFASQCFNIQFLISNKEF